MGLLLANNVSGKLKNHILPTDTTIELQPGHGARFPELVGPSDFYYATLERGIRTFKAEIVKVTARVDDILTVERAQDDTIALSFPAETLIEMRLNKAALAEYNSGVGGTAAGITYDNSTSGLTSANVQDAIDEVVTDIPRDAADISYDNTTSLLTATDVQAAIDEIAASSGGSAASVTYDNATSGLVATNVQAAIDEVVSDIPANSTEISYDHTTSGLTATTVQGAIDEVVGDIPADAGDLLYDNTTSLLVATNVQAAIDEVATANVGTELVGAIKLWGSASIPPGYLACNGQAVSRALYNSLFSVIGTTFGVGDNSTTFNVPNFQGVVPKGVGSQTINTRTKTGPALGVAEEDQMQGHHHNRIRFDGSKRASGSYDTVNSAGDFAGTDLVGDPSSDGTNGTPRTGATTRENCLGIYFIIKY